MISPTGKGVRTDSKGYGHYGAPRGGRKHKGTDYLCEPGQNIIAPISGKIIRAARPYADTDEYSGCVIAGETLTVKMFYFEPDQAKVGHYVFQGDKIGIAQDISKRHSPDMKPHIHLEIESINPDIFISQL